MPAKKQSIHSRNKASTLNKSYVREALERKIDLEFFESDNFQGLLSKKGKQRLRAFIIENKQGLRGVATGEVMIGVLIKSIFSNLFEGKKLDQSIAGIKMIFDRAYGKPKDEILLKHDSQGDIGKLAGALEVLSKNSKIEIDSE